MYHSPDTEAPSGEKRRAVRIWMSIYESVAERRIHGPQFRLPDGDFTCKSSKRAGRSSLPLIRTTGLSGGLLTPYKGSLPTLESKDSSNEFTGSPENRSIYSFNCPYIIFLLNFDAQISNRRKGDIS